MKVCPQCNSGYPEDFLFCLTDGNVLVDEGGEQETVIRKKIVFGEKTDSLPPNMLVECQACRVANRGNSKFCKNCGAPLAGAKPPVQQPSPAASAAFGFSQAPPQNVYENPPFQTPVFTPPASPGYQTGGGKKRQNNIIVAAVIVGVAIIAGAVIYSSQSGSKPSGTITANNSKTSPTPSPSATPRPIANVAPANINAAPASARKGHLTTNQRLRSDSNRYAEILGVHYQGAKVEILDETTYSTEDGTLATWYRVRVVQDGCDREGSMGCGNDLDGVSGQAAREGWMNAKYIALD
jgi:hypothetical protein